MLAILITFIWFIIQSFAVSIIFNIDFLPSSFLSLLLMSVIGIFISAFFRFQFYDLGSGGMPNLSGLTCPPQSLGVVVFIILMAAFIYFLVLGISQFVHIIDWLLMEFHSWKNPKIEVVCH